MKRRTDILNAKVVQTLEQHHITYEAMTCDPDLADTATFCEHYGFGLDESANTILVASRKVEPTKYAVCVVLGATRLDVNKKVCQLLGVKKASFASGEQTTELTGMMIGGVTAIGIADLPLYVDEAVMRKSRVVMGGGNRSSKVVLDPHELEKLPNVQIIPDLAKPKDQNSPPAMGSSAPLSPNPPTRHPWLDQGIQSKNDFSFLNWIP
jgi:prolyl-tRNA editing enzyme YbaK/EbsC (Cys-tRNA(Pro) deacylase)